MSFDNYRHDVYGVIQPGFRIIHDNTTECSELIFLCYHFRNIIKSGSFGGGGLICI